MQKLNHFLPNMKKILLPIDDSDASERAVKFAACLLAPLAKRVVKEVVLLHVLGVSFVEKMAANIDLRVQALKETPLFKRLAQEYIQREIEPFLDKAESFLQEAGVDCLFRKEIIEGDPCKEIVQYALKNNIHTIIMGRRRRSAIAETVLGSCSYAVCHRPGAHTDYIVGQEEVNLKACPIPFILVPVDGSRPSFNAVREAGGLALAFPDSIVQLTLVHVIESAYADQMENVEEGNNILGETKEKLVEMGLSPEKIETELRFGDPAEEIVQAAEEKGHNIIIMGRTGKGGLKELILGSVSSRVLHLAVRPTVALVSA